MARPRRILTIPEPRSATTDRPPVHIAELADLCHRHPTARKVVFAPSAQAGRAARGALARTGVPYIALEVTTPAAHAREWLGPADVAAGWRRLPFFSEGFLLESLVEHQSRRGRTTLRAAGTRPAALRDTVEALRMAGLRGDDLRRGAGGDSRHTARRVALADLLDGYQLALDAGRYLDDAATLQLAIRHIEREPRAGGTVYAVFDETALAPLEERLLRALTEGGSALVRIGYGTPGLAPPRRSALARFWPEAAGEDPAGTEAGPSGGAWVGAATPPEVARDVLRAQMRVDGNACAGIRRAVGPVAEVRDALRDVLARGLPLDDVEFAYAANDPYLMILQTEARLRALAVEAGGDEREGLPMTFAAGLPVAHTRVGQALRGLLDWLEAGHDTAVLVRLLQARLLVIDRASAAPNHKAAHDLVRGGRGTGPDAHTRALDRAELVHRQAPERDASEETLAKALHSLQITRVALDRLVAALPAEGATPGDFARGLLSVLTEFGPVDPLSLPSIPRDEPLTADQRAFIIVRDRLRAFASEPPVADPVTPVAAASALRDAALGAFIGALGPRPGHLHVVPRDSAGFAGRKHLYVLGLDAETSAPASSEDALLPDRDREVIDPAGELLERGSDRAGAQGWSFARVLARVPPDGSVTLCASAHEVVGGNALFPGGLLLRAADLARLDLAELIEPPDAPAGLVPRLDAPAVALHEVEADLAFRHDPARQEIIAARHPVAARGRFADEERASGRWTMYDGWLGGPRPSLDPLATDGTVSPTRLESLATCPYRYLLQHVLRISPPPEALDEEDLLTPAERGTLLHTVFERFTRRLRERAERPAAAHEDEISALTEEVIDEMLTQRGDPAPAARAALGRAMTDVTRVFLRDEVRHADHASPVALEHPFGIDEPVRLELASDVVVRLRGFVDRVEQRSDGAYEVVDFKTGSAWGYADIGQAAGEVLARGRRLQWALYAHALRQSEGWNVTHAGYRFVSTREYAERRSYPLPAIGDVADVLRAVVAPARGGFFPQVPGDACRFCDVRRACGDIERRAREVRSANEHTAADEGAEAVILDWARRHAR